MVETQSLIQKQPYPTEQWTWQGHSICYTAVGQGQPIVLVHGFGASIGHWRKNIPELAEAGYRVFAIDLLGFGQSDKPPLNYSLEVWQELLYDFWTAHIQTPATFVGNSIGGLLTLMMMAKHPDAASSGVLLNCAGGLNHRPSELNPVLRFVMGSFTTLVSSPVTGPFVFNRIRQKSRLRSTLKQVYVDQTAITDELIDILYEPSCDPGAQKVFASIVTAPAGPHPTELLPHIQQPLLILWGENDPWTPIKGAAIYQDMAQQEPHRVQFDTIPNAGHCPHDEHPEQVNRFILDWLMKVNR
ncbi:MAG: alpha/beta fold hydrolase [Cyanobacteria bacterium J06633_2]